MKLLRHKILDITPEMLYYAFEDGVLSMIEKKWGHYGNKCKIGFDLNQLCKTIREHTEIEPANIMAICLYGSILNKNHQDSSYRDIDIMVILFEAIEDKTYFTVPLQKDRLVQYERRWNSGYGSCTEFRAGNLHIVFRSVEQFCEGIFKGTDGLAISVLQKGCPFVGISAFTYLIRDIDKYERRCESKIKWKKRYSLSASFS